MGAFGITAICPSTTVSDVHTFGYATERTSGSLLRVYADSGTASKMRFHVSAVGDVNCGAESGGTIANNATGGFFALRSGNGTPTGTPSAASTGRAQVYYDYTNDLLYIYNGSWRSVAVT